MIDNFTTELMKRLIQSTVPKIGFIVSFLVFVFLNYDSYSWNRRTWTCLDCGWQAGFPFPLYEVGGIVSYENIIWMGLIADLAFAVTISLWVGVLFRFIATKRAPQL